MKRILCRILEVIFVCLFLMSVSHADFPVVSIKSVSSSSQYPSDSSSYYPGNAVDGDDHTAWFPNRTDKANIGEWIKFEFDRKYPISAIEIINGWIKSDNLFWQNSRVKSLHIEFPDGHRKLVALENIKDPQRFDFPAIEADWVRFIIEEIYPGEIWNHEAGITDVKFNGKEHRIVGRITSSNSVAEETKIIENALLITSHLSLPDGNKINTTELTPLIGLVSTSLQSGNLYHNVQVSVDHKKLKAAGIKDYSEINIRIVDVVEPEVKTTVTMFITASSKEKHPSKNITDVKLNKTNNWKYRFKSRHSIFTGGDVDWMMAKGRIEMTGLDNYTVVTQASAK